MNWNENLECRILINNRKRIWRLHESKTQFMNFFGRLFPFWEVYFDLLLVWKIRMLINWNIVIRLYVPNKYKLLFLPSLFIILLPNRILIKPLMEFWNSSIQKFDINLIVSTYFNAKRYFTICFEVKSETGSCWV